MVRAIWRTPCRRSRRRACRRDVPVRGAVDELGSPSVGRGSGLLRAGPHDPASGATRRIEAVARARPDYAINPRGPGHTADTDEPVVALFITAGKGTQNRPR